jgi:hypothetical protein
VNFPRFAVPAASIGLLLVGALAGGASFTAPSAAATPPPTPPPLPQPAASPEQNSTPIPMPSGYGFPTMGQPAPGASSSPTPPPDARKGIEGVWELQIQRGSSVDYAHFKLSQSGSTISGQYLNDAGKRFPIAGSLDGQAVRLVVSMPDGSSLLLEGRLDGTTDMIGMLTTSKEQVPFTAAYRAKEKWIDNLNASPGGIGSGSGGGGYGPP